MKKIIIPSIVIIIGSLMALFCMSSAAPQNERARLFSTANPDVPTSIKICGQLVDLDRTDMWERYDRELTALTYSHASTLLTLKRANKYFPVMAPILKKRGIPEDILYLACIESTLNPRAVSSAKAAGIWQFMPSTAQQYGLEVSDEVDERYNVELATEAACKYLASAFKKYGNWESVMASYNAGMGRISKELEAQMAKSAFDIYLNDETSRYMFRIMAMKAIMENPSAYGFALRKNQLYQPEESTVVEVSEPVADWCKWAASHNITYAQLREANPWIRDKKLTNKAKKTYKVKIPTKKSLSRKNQAKTIYNKHWTID